MKKVALIVLMMISANANAGIIYSEDFSTDPGFTSLAPSLVNWNSGAENYQAETYRNNNQKYWAYKDVPSFQSTALKTISVDIFYETLNQLTYPAFRFFADEPIESASLTNPYGLGFSQYNCCNDPDRFAVYDGLTGSREISTNHITSGVWYNILMEFSSDLTFDALVTERNSGNVILDAEDLTYADTSYSYFGIGYYATISPNVGPTTMLVDNIQITTVPAPQSGVLFAFGLLLLINARLLQDKISQGKMIRV